MNETKKSFNYWQIRTIIITIVGYALYYFVRKNFSIAMPGLTAEFGISKVSLGLFLTLHGIIYGLSRFVNGIISDRNSARIVVSIGLMLCALANFLFGFSDTIAGWIVALANNAGTEIAFSSVLLYFMGIVWVINGYLQGMGVPPITKTITQWVHPKELATKLSIWNMSHSIGAGLVFGLCGWYIMPHLGVDMTANAEAVANIASNLGLEITDPKVLSFAAHYYAWRWCFIIPAVFATMGAIGLFTLLKDSPSDVGLPEVVGKKKAIVRTPEESAEYKAFVRRKVFGNRLIWTLALTNFFVYVVRFAALDWGPTLLIESKGLTLAVATTLCIVFEFIGGNIGMVVAGWATDHIFKNKAHHTCVFCMIGASLSIAAFWLIPTGSPWWVMIVPFTFIGFFIYGPQALLGVAAANQATNRAAATANGILGIFGYASTLISGVGFGFVAQHYGWNGAYITILVMAILGIVSLLTMWSAKADGYEEQK
jgi:OPA family glycerol-3-phosphate transporter-like MFS transporter/OPA family sugar phosphate sensor protein UhpC-like MFS transporter